MPKIKKVKMKKSEIKKDRFAEFVMGLFAEFTENWQKYVIILVVLVLIIMGVQYFTNSMKKKNEVASKEMYNAVQTYLSGNYEGAIELFDQVKSQYYGTQASKNSTYYIACANMYMNKYDDALQYFNQFLKTHSKNDILIQNTYIAIAHCYESKTEVDSALVYYKKLLEKYPDGFQVPEAYMGIARISELKMDITEALSNYNKIIYGYPNTQYANLAVVYRNMLDGALDVLKQMQVNKAVKEIQKNSQKQ